MTMTTRTIVSYTLLHLSLKSVISLHLVVAKVKGPPRYMIQRTTLLNLAVPYWLNRECERDELTSVLENAHTGTPTLQNAHTTPSPANKLLIRATKSSLRGILDFGKLSLSCQMRAQAREYERIDARREVECKDERGRETKHSQIWKTVHWNEL